MLANNIKLNELSLKPPSLPNLIDLLTTGGDWRITLAPDTGVNAYGYAATPNPSAYAFGSSTCSQISARGFEQSLQRLQHLQERLNANDFISVYDDELEQLRQRLHRLLTLPQHTDIVFSPSGTDAHGLLARLLAYRVAKPLTIIMMDSHETGRGVASALIDSQNDALKPILHSVRLRQADSQLRLYHEIDTETEALIVHALNHQHHVLLIMIDQSKTGLIAPSLASVLALKQRYGDALTVLVDACQFRLAPDTLSLYLKQDFIVAVTGSKFLTGPAFSGALLIPETCAQWLKSKALPNTIARLSNGAEWPNTWPGREQLGLNTNFGLLLRWHAALDELELLLNFSDTQISGFIQRFQHTLIETVSQYPALEWVTTPEPNRQALTTFKHWDSLATIWTLRLPRYNEAQVLAFYQTLQQRHYQLGQPVVIGTQDSTRVTGLRLSLSARLIVEALADSEQTVMAKAVKTLTKLAGD